MEKIKDVPYLVHESIVTRLERIIERMWILTLVLIIVLIGSNIAWLYYEKQFEDTTTTITQELDSRDGGNAIINDGVHFNGENKTNNNN